MIVKVVFLVLIASIIALSQAERKYYHYKGSRGDFQDAKSFCRKKGQTLAMPKTASEWVALKTAIAPNLTDAVDFDFWLGLKRDSGQEFEYANGEALVYENWFPGQPDNLKRKQACVYVGSGKSKAQWRDFYCEFEEAFVCQFVNGTSSVSYQAYLDKMSYINAGVSCRDKGGELAMPKSADENQQILDAAKNTGQTNTFYWIGIQRALVNWRWLDGELQTFNFNAWKDGQPNYRFAREYCAFYSDRYHLWYDERCGFLFDHYVCQNYYGLCIDRKPLACEKKIQGLSPVQKFDYCQKKWPMLHCQESCGCK